MTIQIIDLKFWRSKLNLFLSQSKQQQEKHSAAAEWFSQGEGDPWHTSSPQITDPWASKSGSDVWEMVKYSDPFSVHYSTTSPIEDHPEFSSSSTAGPNSFSTVSTASLSTEGSDG